MTEHEQQEHGLALGRRLELSLDGEPAVAIVFACCWVLAAVIVQAAEDQGREVDPLRAVEVIAAQLGRSVADLLAAREAVKH